MLLGARQFFERRGAPTPPLPYDAEVEYLESTGTQYINTRFLPHDGLTFRCQYKMNDLSITNADVFGCQTETFSYLEFGRMNRGGYIRWAPASSLVTTTIEADTSWHSMEMSVSDGASSLKIDGTLISNSAFNTFYEDNIAVAVFARVNSNGNSYIRPCSVYTFSITDSSTGDEIIDCVSVRFTNELGQSEGAMYDRVSGELFRNAGTGAFLYGHDKS